MHTIPELRTKRLVLRPLALADAQQVQPLFARWEIVKHLNAVVPWPYPSDGVFHYYRDVALPAIESGEEWAWTLRLREVPDQIIGAISLGCREDNNRGFWMGLPWQGRGLMSEAVVVTNDFWFDVLCFQKLRVPKARENRSSSRISAKTGMRLIAIKDHDFVCGRLPAEIWELSAQDWREHKRLHGL
jgi:[ribosomal protein S5]-alanine N-acetyltransferase